MSIAPPLFPKNLEPASWKSAAKKDDITGFSDIDDLIDDISSSFRKIKWADLDPTLAKDIETFDDNFEQVFTKATDELGKKLAALLKLFEKHKKELQKSKAAKICRNDAESLQTEIDAYKMRIESSLQKLLAKQKQEAAKHEDQDDEEDMDETDKEDADYDLKRSIRMAKKRPMRFLLGRIVPTSDHPLKVQLFISKKNLNKEQVARTWPQFGKPKVMAKGILTFGIDPADGMGKFLYLCKAPPSGGLAKQILKVLKFYRCASLGGIALGTLQKGQDPELDADAEQIETVTDLDETDAPGAPDATLAQVASATLAKLSPSIKQALNSGIDAKKREQLTQLVMLARRQIDDGQETKASTTLQAVAQFLHKLRNDDSKSETEKTDDIFSKLAAFLKKMLEGFKKTSGVDKLIVSEFNVLARRADRQIKDHQQQQAAETLREMERLLKTTAAASSSAKKQEAPPPPPPPPPPPARPAASTDSARPSERKLNPYVKFNVVRIESWNAAQTKIKSQINAFRDAVVKAAEGEADISEIKANINNLMDQITGYGDEVTDALDKLAADWSKAKSAGKTIEPHELDKLEATHEANRKEVNRLLSQYQTALDRHEITTQLDDNPFGSFGITTTIQTAIKKLKDALL